MQRLPHHVLLPLLLLPVMGCAGPRAPESAPAPVASPPPPMLISTTGVPERAGRDAARLQAFAAQRDAVIARPGAPVPLNRLSLDVPPTPFDRTAWERDPWTSALAYAQVAEPGRIQQVSATDGDPDLLLLTPGPWTVPSLGRLDLQLKTLPFAPVSAYSQDKGTFANGLVYTTVIADADGIAVLTVEAGPGVHHAIEVVIASPCAPQPLNLIIDTLP